MILRLHSTDNENTDLISEMEMSAALSTTLFRTVTGTKGNGQVVKRMVPNPVPGMVGEETLITKHYKRFCIHMDKNISYTEECLFFQINLYAVL